jgi:hypothetical protein
MSEPDGRRGEAMNGRLGWVDCAVLGSSVVANLAQSGASLDEADKGLSG